MPNLNVLFRNGFMNLTFPALRNASPGSRSNGALYICTIYCSAAPLLSRPANWFTLQSSHEVTSPPSLPSTGKPRPLPRRAQTGTPSACSPRSPDQGRPFSPMVTGRPPPLGRPTRSDLGRCVIGRPASRELGNRPTGPARGGPRNMGDVKTRHLYGPACNLTPAAVFTCPLPMSAGREKTKFKLM